MKRFSFVEVHCPLTLRTRKSDALFLLLHSIFPPRPVLIHLTVTSKNRNPKGLGLNAVAILRLICVENRFESGIIFTVRWRGKVSSKFQIFGVCILYGFLEDRYFHPRYVILDHLLPSKRANDSESFPVSHQIAGTHNPSVPISYKTARCIILG